MMNDNQNTLEQIMNEIRSNLSGDADADLRYIHEQMETYKNHELAKEIIRACGRLMSEIMPEELRQKMQEAMKKDFGSFNDTIRTVHEKIDAQEFETALKLMEELVEKIESLHGFEDDSLSEYRYFHEPFEEVLYLHTAKPEKEVRHAGIDYTEVYMLYGSLLVEHKQYEKAQTELRKGLHYNPADFFLAMEYIETFKALGKIDEFFRLTKEAFKIAFRRDYIARCYRNLGYYFIEKQLWSEAVSCYLMSQVFEPDASQAANELFYIEQKTEGKVKQPSPRQLHEYAEKYGFPLGPDGDVLRIAYSYGKHYMDQKAFEPARYFLSIAYDLTEDDTVKKMLDTISRVS